MNNDTNIALLKSVISFLKEKGKSEDVANLLMKIEVEEPSVLHDFLTELSLASHPEEEEGVGSYSIDDIEQAFNDYLKTGENSLYKELK